MSTSKTVNIIIFGIGNVGSTLINQINAARESIWGKDKIHLRIPVITNSKIAFFDQEGISNSWESDFSKCSVPYEIEDIFKYTKAQNFENLIAVDVTSSKEFAKNYIRLVQNGFNIVSANKIANTLNHDSYDALRQSLRRNNKSYLYETNVGAGLPIIETIRNLHNSGERIEKIRGVFSGSLSYIFNTFSENNISFSKSINEAEKFGLTETDPREDLSGNDVARKLLILARELGVKKEMYEVKVESLVPKSLNGKTTLNQFRQRIKELDVNFDAKKSKLAEDKVLRYVGELNLSEAQLEVKLVEEDSNSSLGQLKGADSIFEIHSESYSSSPLVIQGAGAGNSVTARGVLSDVLKISKQLH